MAGLEAHAHGRGKQSSQQLSRPTYTGRFAPSPTGPLHFGSLIAAVGSHLDARAHGGRWLLRMEDLDEPRCRQAHADEILRVLEDYGFEWDGEVAYQSRRKEIYQAALDRLVEAGHAYPCACSRSEIADSSIIGIEGPVYPGTCRNGLHGRTPRAWRVRVDSQPVCFEDRLQGGHCQNLEADIGDFVIRRADGFFAYQLAVVVDDHDQGVTHVVRGADLLASTPRQIHLQRLLGYATPAYLHLPVAVNEAGRKLSKQTLAAPLKTDRAGPSLLAALRFLGQRPDETLAGAKGSEILDWAAANWSLPAGLDKTPFCRVPAA
ncbi:MAG: tRNA glutamyl-Q(34) synthetase GluQRS [Pseudomonadota bacterium]